MQWFSVTFLGHPKLESLNYTFPVFFNVNMVKFMKVNLVSFTSTIGSFNSSVNLQFCVKIAMFHHGKSTTRDGSEERRTVTKFRLQRRLTNVNFPFLLIS